MKPKLLLCLALVLSGVLSGCKSTRVFIPPSAIQVGEWAGFPDNFQLNRISKPLTNNEASFCGKLMFDCHYENRARSLVTFEIEVFEPGTCWGTNRTVMTKLIEEYVAKKKPSAKTQSLLKDPFQIDTLPNGRKVYFAVLGITHGGGTLMGFSYGKNYDLMVLEDFAEDSRLPEEEMKQPVSPTNDLRVVFGKVKVFLDAQ